MLEYKYIWKVHFGSTPLTLSSSIEYVIGKMLFKLVLQRIIS